MLKCNIFSSFCDLSSCELGHGRNRILCWAIMWSNISFRRSWYYLSLYSACFASRGKSNCSLYFLVYISNSFDFFENMRKLHWCFPLKKQRKFKIFFSMILSSESIQLRDTGLTLEYHFRRLFLPNLRKAIRSALSKSRSSLSVCLCASESRSNSIYLSIFLLFSIRTTRWKRPFSAVHSRVAVCCCCSLLFDKTILRIGFLKFVIPVCDLYFIFS